MRRWIGLIISTLVLTSGCGGVDAGDAQVAAHGSPSSSPSIDELGDLDLFSRDLCADGLLKPGADFRITGFNFLSNEEVQISWSSVEDSGLHGELGAFTTDGQGQLAAKVRLPRSVQGESIEVDAVGPSPAGYTLASEFFGVGAC